jgi:hypothetical protein
VFKQLTRYVLTWRFSATQTVVLIWIQVATALLRCQAAAAASSLLGCKNKLNQKSIKSDFMIKPL